MHAPCIQCKKRRVTRKWAPFCSQRCAANRGRECTMDAYWCPLCEREVTADALVANRGSVNVDVRGAGWREHECPDHPGQALAVGIDEVIMSRLSETMRKALAHVVSARDWGSLTLGGKRTGRRTRDALIRRGLIEWRDDGRFYATPAGRNAVSNRRS